MARIRVKICGFTRIEDALAAAELGVDAIGLVFYPPSPRAVEVAQARRIALALPPFVTTVGLFVDAGAAAIEAVLRRVPLDLIQFHGNETPADCERLDRPYIKAIRMAEGVDLRREAERFESARGLLLDAYHPGVPGGTGKRFDWDLIPEDLPRPVILAGGLEAGNINAAIERVRPWAVDVSSGVERGKGIKDRAKMKAFLREVNDGDCT
ncbi:phosphoribosylanthranilate isomerase [Methylohalobius crimeensis]|uniref:phosphoribosylanthranilate isomerase n=1 Tax=Methylohalobius crimeensis TaxID=244365 RepID=UPI0003B5F3DC|nr:phosphoribosylanthranilate isomerase [Methylohalobius crimeensis]